MIWQDPNHKLWGIVELLDAITDQMNPTKTFNVKFTIPKSWDSLEVLNTMIQDFHANNSESYPENKMKAEIIKINECQVCGYDETECNIVNNLCSVHTCEICGEEGFASPPKGDILCEKHGGQ